MRRVWIWCCCLCVVSCGDNKRVQRPTVPVSGKILVNGQPAKGVQIVLHYQGEVAPDERFAPGGTTKDDGSFILATYGTEDGAPEGNYKVEMVWPAWHMKRDDGPDKFAGRFADPATSGLTATVTKGQRELPPFDLQCQVYEAERPKTGGKRIR
jgi:hypothetical protein